MLTMLATTEPALLACSCCTSANRLCYRRTGWVYPCCPILGHQATSSHPILRCDTEISRLSTYSHHRAAVSCLQNPAKTVSCQGHGHHGLVPASANESYNTPNQSIKQTITLPRKTPSWQLQQDRTIRDSVTSTFLFSAWTGSSTDNKFAQTP
jgi:hypothetical protein